MVETYATRSIKTTLEEFSIRYPEQEPPSKSTVQRNVLKYRTHATSEDRRKGNSGRQKTVRTPETVRNAVRVMIPGAVSALKTEVVKLKLKK